MLTKSRQTLLAALVVASVCIALYVATRRDTEYLSSTAHPDGSSTVQTLGVKFRHASNRDAYQRATTAIGRQDYIGAERMLREIIERTPDELVAWHGLGTTLFHQRRYRESREAYEYILRQDPHHYQARFGLGAIERVMRRYPEAAQQYSLALQEDATSALAYFGRGVSYFHSGKRAEALADLNRVVELLPPSAALAIEAKQYILRLKDG